MMATMPAQARRSPVSCLNHWTAAMTMITHEIHPNRRTVSRMISGRKRRPVTNSAMATGV